MAALSNLGRKNIGTCLVCCSQFEISISRANLFDISPADSRKIQTCSKLCRWQLQYNLGIIHGFLLCDILQKFIESEADISCRTALTCVALHSPENTHIHDSDACNSNTQHTKTSDIGASVKIEESASDLEEFDCTVSFQNDVQLQCYGNKVINKEGSDPEIVQVTSAFQKKSAEMVSKMVTSRKVHLRTCTKSNHVVESTNMKGCKIFPATEKAFKKTRLKQKSTEVANEKPVNNEKRTTQSKAKERKVSLRLKRKWKGPDTNWGTEKNSKEKHKLPKKDDKHEDTAEELKTENEEDTVFRCEFCSKSFSAKRFMQRHLNHFHSEEIEIRCEICGDCCKNQKYLSVHMRKEHSLLISNGEESFYCDQCLKSFNSRRGLTLHKEFVHSQENPVNCKVCNLTLKNEIYLKRHMKRSHSDSIICDICGAKFKSRLALSSHLSAHRGVKSYFCEVCGMGFVRKTSLRRHVQQHNDVSYTCDTCPSSYKTFGSLSLHMLQIHQRGPYFNNRLSSVEKLGYVVDKEAINRHLNGQCVVCGEKLMSGVCAIHPTSYALMFKCNRCDLTAERIDDLLAHLRDHSSGMSSSSISVSFDCKVCHKIFPRKLYLNQHLKKHHPGANMTSLSIHPATLTYCCQICGKHFQQKQYLYVHMKQHLQPGSFTCHVCDRKFTYKCNLKNHLTTHSDDKPYKCDVCSKMFRRKEVLNSHRLVHNPSLSPFKCHICGKGLSRKQYLKKHYQIMHPEAQDSQLPPLPPSGQLSSMEQPPPPVQPPLSRRQPPPKHPPPSVQLPPPRQPPPSIQQPPPQHPPPPGQPPPPPEQLPSLQQSPPPVQPALPVQQPPPPI